MKKLISALTSLVVSASLIAQSTPGGVQVLGPTYNASSTNSSTGQTTINFTASGPCDITATTHPNCTVTSSSPGNNADGPYNMQLVLTGTLAAQQNLTVYGGGGRPYMVVNRTGGTFPVCVNTVGSTGACVPVPNCSLNGGNGCSLTLGYDGATERIFGGATDVPACGGYVIPYYSPSGAISCSTMQFGPTQSLSVPNFIDSRFQGSTDTTTLSCAPGGAPGADSTCSITGNASDFTFQIVSGPAPTANGTLVIITFTPALPVAPINCIMKTAFQSASSLDSMVWAGTQTAPPSTTRLAFDNGPVSTVALGTAAFYTHCFYPPS